jgi:hypothetical protein
MGSSEARSPLAVWQERFHWARYHFLAYGPLAILAATAYTELGAVSLVAFAIPPILLAHSMRDHFRRTYKRSAADPSHGRSEIETLAA